MTFMDELNKVDADTKRWRRKSKEITKFVTKDYGLNDLDIKGIETHVYQHFLDGDSEDEVIDWAMEHVDHWWPEKTAELKARK
jgi:hypothetical protein